MKMKNCVVIENLDLKIKPIFPMKTLESYITLRQKEWDSTMESV